MALDFSEADFATEPTPKEALGSGEHLTFDESDFEQTEPLAAPFRPSQPLVPATAKDVAETTAMGSPGRELAAGLKGTGRLLVGGLADLGKTFFRPVTDELYPSQAVPGAVPDGLENIIAAPNTKIPLPAENLAPLPRSAQFAGHAAQGLIGSAPQVGAVAALQAGGVPAPVGAGLVFGQTEEGFDPVQGVTAAALPLVGRASGGIVGTVAKLLGVESTAALNWMKGIAGTAGPASALLIQGEHQINKLPEDQREEARSKLWESIAGQAALGPMGVKFERQLPRANLAAIAAAKQRGAADASRLRTDEGQVQAGGVEQPSGQGEGRPNLEQPAPGQPSGQPSPQTQTGQAQPPRVLLSSDVGKQIQAGIGTLSDESEFADFSRRIMEAQRAKVINPMEAQALRRQIRQQRESLKVPVLTPEEKGFIDAERKAIDAPVDVVEQPADPNDPFARKPKAGQIAGINRAKGTVEIYPKEFAAWLDEDVPADKRQVAIRSLLAEEQNHLAATPEHADTYWNSLTAAEKAIEQRLYTSKWSGRPDVSNTDLGFEAIRRRMQRLARMDTTETVRTVGTERWKLKSLEALNDTIRGIRETLGTKASKEGLAILDKVQANLDAGIVAAGGQLSTPTADDLLNMKPEEMAAYLKDVKYSPTDAARWGQQMTAADIERLDTESQRLRDATSKALSETREMQPGPGRDAKMNEALRASLKAQTLREVVEDYQPQAEPAALRPVGKKFEEWRDQYQRTANELSGLRERLRNYPDFRRVTQERIPWQEVSEMPADVQKLYRLTQFLHELQSMPEYDAFEKAVGLGAINRGEGMPRIGPGTEPAALRPKKGKEQPELYLPPETNVPHKTFERPSAIEMGAKPFTAVELDRAGYQHLEEATAEALSQSEAGKAPKPPSFQAYKTALQHQFGDLQPGQLYESYSRNLYKRLLNASGQHLAAVAKSIGIRAGAVPEPAMGKAPLLEREGESPDVRAQMRAERATMAQRQRYRTTLIGRIADKLLKEAAPDTKPTAKTVSPEDVRAPGDSKEPSFWDVSASDLDTPAVLAQRLTQDARRSGKDPVSLTKRLTALLDKQSGRVYLVSTYPHGRAGAMLLDPSVSTLRNHRPLPDLLKRYRPVSSVLLDEPVKNFRQEFNSLGDFENRFAADARRGVQQSFPEPLLEGDQPVEGSWERGEPITDAEAGAILDHVTAEVGRFEEVDDVKASLAALKEDTNPQVLSAYRKLSEELLRKNPDLSNEGLINQLAQNIYDTHKAAPDYETFVKRTMAQGGATYQPGVEVGRKPAPGETGKELTMPIERRPPTDVRPENIPAEAAAKLGTKPAPPVPQGAPVRATSEPGALRPIKDVSDEVRAIGEVLKTIVTRTGVINDVARVLDSAANTANNFSRQEETRIRLPSVKKPLGRLAERFTQWERGDKQVLAAANALVESKFSKPMLPIFKNQVRNGLARAQQMLQSNSFRERRIGAAWERAGNELMAELEYADQHWNDPELQETARRVKQALDEQYDREKAAGYEITKDPNYLPHRYDASLWNGNSVLFQEMRLWGKKWREPKTFDSHYEAIAAGPYLPVTRDSASLVGHRVRQGTSAIIGREWHAALKAIDLPDGTKLAIDPALGTHSRWVSPNPNYDIVELGGGQKPLAVQADYSRALRSVLNPHSVIEDWGPSRALLHLSQVLKHSLLIGDFFHLARMGYYGASILGKNFGWKGGWSVLDIAERDAPEALQRGVIRPQDAAWANEQVPFGNTTISRRGLVQKFYREMGSNLGKIQDALYKELVTNLTPTAGPLRRGLARITDPTIGGYNRFLFDRLTRGLMAESVAREFERQTKAAPNADPNALMRDIAKDVNNFYGNIGRQGLLKAKWQQDLARIFILAPQWVEGLVRKEASTYSRLSGASSLAGARRGVTTLGTTARSVGRAMVFMFGLTQAINLITRGKPTWQNEEEGHKLDAWIPAWGSDEDGFWMSPLTIFNEITHDLYRLGEAKYRDGKPVLDAVTQIAGNKESPVTRALVIMGTGKTPQGEQTTTSMGRIGAAAGAMAPLPITFGRYAQAAGHAMAPETVRAVAPGQIQRQAFGTAGMKIEPALSIAADVRRQADQFMRKNGLKKETGWEQIQTDEPSYSKLRSAIRASDDARAAKLLDELRKGRTDLDIIKAMKKHSVGPFTGSVKAERQFLGSLDDKGIDRYSQARDQLMGDFERFISWYLRQPVRTQPQQ